MSSDVHLPRRGYLLNSAPEFRTRTPADQRVGEVRGDSDVQT